MAIVTDQRSRSRQVLVLTSTRTSSSRNSAIRSRSGLWKIGLKTHAPRWVSHCIADSSGIATLIEVLKKARILKKDFVLFGLGPAVHAVLKLTNLLGVFQVFDSEEHALDG